MTGRIFFLTLALLPFFLPSDVLSKDLARPDCAAATGIYLQEDPMTAAYKAGQLGKIVKVRGPGVPSEVELNLFKPLTYDQWEEIWKAAGLDPKEDNVIIDFKDKGWVSMFRKTVDAGKKLGMTSVAPIFSPNGKTLPLDSWSKNSRYADIRQAALMGGGLVLDPPPGYFFQRGTAYQEFSYQQVRWSREHHIRSTVIISPYGDDKYFLQNVQKYVALFAAHDAVPTEWVLENYNSSVDNGVACKTSPNSLAGVSSWLSANGPASKGTGVRESSTVGKHAPLSVPVFLGISPHT